MFANTMKILTLTTTNTTTVPLTNATVNTKQPQHNNNNNMQERRNSSPKMKSYINGNSNNSNNSNNASSNVSNKTQMTSSHQQQQQQQQQKYNHNKNSKKQHHANYNGNNNNNNSTNNTNRKKYYQQNNNYHNNHSSNNNYNNNNNNSLMKNQNVDLIICTPTSTVLKHHNNNQSNNKNNVNGISKNYNNAYEQQHKQQQQHHTATSSTLTVVSAVAAVKSNFLKTLATQSPTTSAPNNNNTNTTTTTTSNTNSNKSRSNSNCLSCWTSFTKLQQQKQQQGNTNKTKSSPATSTPPLTSNCSANSSSLSPSPSASPLSSSSGDLDEFICKSKSSISNNYNNSARQSSWKISSINNLATAKGNNISSPNQQQTVATAGSQKVKSTTASTTISNNKQSSISACIVVDNKNTRGTTTATTTITSTKKGSAMTTTLATGKVSSANSKSTNEQATITSSTIKTTSTTTIDNVVTTTTPTIVTNTATTTLNTVAKTTTAKTATVITSTACTITTTAPTTTLVGPSSPNSYSLDFLHSVGAQMTEGANVAALKTTSMSNMRATTATNSADYNNHKTNADHIQQATTRNTYNYSNLRYMASGSGSQNYENVSGGGSGRNQHYNQHQQHYNHHYHQPQQLTIASFIQKDLLGGTSVGGSSSSPTNNANRNDGLQQQQQQQQQRQNYHNQPRYHHNYYQSHYHQQQQQQQQKQQQQAYTTTMQHAYNAVVGENMVRLTGNSSNINSGNVIQANNQRLQQNRAYQTYHSNNKVTTNVPSQQQHRAVNNNNNINASIQVKKSNFNSSSSSSSSVSSLASNSSQNSTASGRVQQNKNKTANSQQHQAIETLPTKINHNRAATQHRPYHSYGHGQYNHHHYQQQQHHHYYHHHNQNHHSISVGSGTGGGGGVTTPTTPQHQNIYNLTYVNTEMLPIPTTESAATSTTPSPQPPAVSPLLINNCPGATVSYYQYGNFLQPHTHFINNKKILPTFTLNVPPPTISQISPPVSIPPTPTPPPLPPANILCCAQLDEAATAAAASTTASNTHESISINTSNDYDSDSSVTSHSTTSSSRRHQKYQHLKSVSISSSSSTASSATSLSEYHQIATAASILPPTTPLHSPIDFSYSALPPLPQQQYAHHQYVAAQPQPNISISPQHVQQHYSNGGVISLLSSGVGSSNSNVVYTDDDATTPHANVQHIATTQQFYFATNDHHFNGNVGTGYWSPLPSNLHHTNFVYSQAAANMLATAIPCSDTRTPSLSPRSSEQQDDQYSQQQHQASTGDYIKRGTMPPTSIATQHQCMPQSQSASSIAVTNIRNVAATAITRGRLNQQHIQSAGSLPEAHHQAQQQISSSAPPPLPPPYQHNLLCNNPPVHLRSSLALNAAHSLDFSGHTPPDRFLARSHSIEAKEAPSTLLNNSKWDSLSQGIWNKFIQNQQTERTFRQKMYLWRHLYIIVKNTYQRFGLYMVGSTISGFGADNSDVDMCLVSRNNSSLDPRTEALCNLNILRDYLSKTASVEFGNFNLIEAKVPILRFTDRTRQLEVDLNFNNSVGIKNTHLLHCYSQLDWRLKPLVLVTKLWAQYHNINNAKNMTISSYSLALMVIHFLQYAVSPPVLPCLHDIYPDKFTLLRSNDFGYIDMIESIDTYESKNIQTLGELFLHFLEYYSCFDFTQHAISVRTGGLLPINVCRQAKSLKNDMHQWKELCIEEPFDLTNTARSVYDFETFERVKSVFVASWHILQETLEFATVFTPIIVSPLQMPTLLHAPSMASPVTISTTTTPNVSVLNDAFKNAKTTTIGVPELQNRNEPNAANALVIVSKRTTQELTGTSVLIERDINFHSANNSSTNNARNNNSSNKNLTAITS